MAKFTVENSRHVKASPQQVWDLMCDWHRWPEWVEQTVEMRGIGEDGMKAGAVYRELSKVGDVEFETEWRITKFEAPRLQVHEHREPDAQIILTMTLEPDRDGTKFTQRVDVDAGPSMEAALAQEALEPGLKMTIDNFVRVAESA